MTGDAPLILHASCVAVRERGLLILGPSGSGKSSLALQMIALGAALVADDRVVLALRDDRLLASCPAPLLGLIEARGLGLLRSAFRESVELGLAVDLGHTETARLPDRHDIVYHGRRIDLVHGPVSAHFPAALMLYLSHGRAA